MIFLNGNPYITEAVESVFNQTYKHWELIFIDDGSTDGSSEVAKKFTDQNPGKVTYLNHFGHQNLGMSASRNLGIRFAKGDFIAFLDADDIWMPQKLTKQVNMMESHPRMGMVYGNVQYWFSWTGQDEDKALDFVPNLGVIPEICYQPPVLLPLFLEGKASVPCTCSVLIRKEIINKVEGFEEVFKGMYEDQAFYSKICLTTPIYVSSECLERYRQHSSSSTFMADREGSLLKSRIFFLNWLKNYLTDNGFQDRMVSRALQRQLWLSSPPRIGLFGFLPPDFVRRIKKWILRLEEWLVPKNLSNRIWVSKY